MALTQSFDVEFDDALLDLEGWKNPRYAGSKLTAAKINEYTAGDTTYGLNPVITNKTTALYIGNTLIGAEEEDEQYVYIKNHSYVDINRILLIDPYTDEVTIIDDSQEEFEPFHRFITTDLPTGGSFNIKLLDFAVQNSLKGPYHVKMNKGWLLRTLKYTPYYSQSDGGAGDNLFFISEPGSAKLMEFIFLSKTTSNTTKGYGPSYISSSITRNKYVDEYYPLSSSTTFMETDPIHSPKPTWQGVSHFIISGTQHLGANIDKNYEMHLTLHEGSYDFAPGMNDERSISTFEIDKRAIHSNKGSSTMDIYPSSIALKGSGVDKRFTPTFSSSHDSFNTYNLDVGASSTVSYATKDIYTKGELTPTGSYSGSYSYELSWLDRSHTLISNIDKESELYDGIGEKGFVIIPEQTDTRIKDNIDYYLEKAGLITKTVTIKSPPRGR